MRPDLSIVTLTALAGIGEGIFIFIVAIDSESVFTGVQVPLPSLFFGAFMALAFTGLGTIASFFHLHHKDRGTKAIRQWRFSWLSREALLLPLFMLFVGGYMALLVIGAPDSFRLMAGLLGIFFAMALAFSSGMIYATITFVKEWNSAFTPVNFFMIGLAVGGAWAVFVLEITGAGNAYALTALRFSIGATFIAMILKFLAYLRNANIYSPTGVDSAIGANHPDVVLMDKGACYEHYNTKEYYHKPFRGLHRIVRTLVVATLFVAPLFLMMKDYDSIISGGSDTFTMVAAVIMVLGTFAERWLFFAEGNHIQNLYYGNFINKGGVNPILVSNKNSAPLPPG